MDKISIQSESHSYNVYVGTGIRHHLLNYFPSDYTAYYIITDQHVQALYSEDVLNVLPADRTFIYSVQPGESSKTLFVYEEIVTDMLELKLDRHSCVIALGGGVVGDLAGFVASTYMRGVNYIQVPTTLLAHDSSVGGKVAINHRLGKNLIGAFYPPVAVVYDTDCLQTLPALEWRSGFAEMIKHALIDSPDFLQELRRSIPNSNYLSSESIRPFLSRAIRVKSKIVAEDEKETGVRMYLNFGHTLGHSIEKIIGTAHGESIATGMLFALFLSIKKGALHLPLNDLTEWFYHLGLPVQLDPAISAQRYIETMGYDKKRNGVGYLFVLLKNIGEPYTQSIPAEDMIQYVQEFMCNGVDINQRFK